MKTGSLPGLRGDSQAGPKEAHVVTETPRSTQTRVGVT